MGSIYTLVLFSSPFCKISLKVTLIRDQGWINVGTYDPKTLKISIFYLLKTERRKHK